jgi:hypothetical protein
MIISHAKRALLTTIATIVIGCITVTAAYAVEVAPTKFVPLTHFGWNVDNTKIKEGAPQPERNICTEASKDECKRGEENEGPGGFVFDETVAVAKNGNVYVGDNVNHRVQEFNQDGAFVLMFGWNVNKTKIKEGAPQPERNVCTAAELAKGAECLSGEEGTGKMGQMLTSIKSVTVDQVTGNVYVYDYNYHRVDEFTENGEFILMIGGDVNKTKVEALGTEAETNVCTAASGNECQAGTESAKGSTAHGAFKPEGGLVSVGGPGDLL